MPTVSVVAIKKRIVTLFLSVALLMFVLVSRLGWVQLVHGGELRGRALAMRMWDVPVEPKRGVIYDRNGRELAISVSAETVYAVPAELRDPQETARALAPLVGMSVDEVVRRLTRVQSVVYVKRKLDPEAAARVRALRLPGIGITEESRRVYPKGKLASHVLGLVGIDSQGLEGVEYTYDKELRGVPGRIVIEHDARGREIPHALHTYVPSQSGCSLVLTIDEAIQFIAERELERGMQLYDARVGSVIVMDVNTGEILALANRPDFHPEFALEDIRPDLWRNRAISDQYEPGSTFKIVAMAAGLEEGVVRDGDRFFCGGVINVPGATIGCVRRAGHGSQSFWEIVENSCNVGFVQLVQRIGRERYYKYLELLNMGRPTGIDLPGEAKGSYRPLEEVKPVELATMAFGQGIAVTPLQLVAAVAALVNGGIYYQPHLVKEIRDAEGTVVEKFEPVALRRVVSPETSQKFRLALEGVIENGTGKRARVEGYRLGGKTGTAQKPVGGRYGEKHVASFVGFGLVDDPKVAVLVVVDEPEVSYYGGRVAAPVFAAVMADVLRYLGEAPREKEPEEEGKRPEVAVPEVRGAPVDGAVESLKQANLGVRLEGQGELVLEQTPKPGAMVPPRTVVILYLGGAAQTVRVPDLAGKTVREAGELLEAMGLRMKLVGSGKAVNQSPAAGSGVPAGSTVSVEFR